MKITPSQTARLEFLVRVTHKECKHLLDTDGRLFSNLFTIEDAKKIEIDPILAERLDAFMVKRRHLLASRGLPGGSSTRCWPHAIARLAASLLRAR